MVGSAGLPPAPANLDSIRDAIPIQESKSKTGNSSYVQYGVEYQILETSAGYVEEGTASWYGPGFQGEPTSSGTPYDMYQMTAAHTSLPLPTYAEVINLDNGRRVVVKIIDRGPFAKGRVIDLSYVAALKLGIVRPGTARVRVRALDPPAR